MEEGRSPVVSREIIPEKTVCEGAEMGADPAVGRHKRRFKCLERRKQEGKYYKIRVVKREALDPSRPEISIPPFSIIFGQGSPRAVYLFWAYKARRAGREGG